MPILRLAGKAPRRRRPVNSALGGRLRSLHLRFRHGVSAWFVILAIAIANGALREAVLIPHIGSVPGTALSGLLLSVASVLVACLLLRRWPAASVRSAAWLGISWLLATLAFEFAFGLARGRSLTELLAAYVFKGGNLWPVVLACLALAPYVYTRFSRAGPATT